MKQVTSSIKQAAVLVVASKQYQRKKIVTVRDEKIRKSCLIKFQKKL
jgi:hypothetical protein